MLPIEHQIPTLQKTLAENCSAVLQAPPGAGKTTCVPLALLDQPWLNHKKIIVLEPRRLAARNAAERMAFLLNQKVGETVGYRMRLDSKIGPNTRIEVVTEGILTRYIQSDPSLEKIGLVIFDEFHERNLNSDLGLALLLDLQEALRDDLRVLVMSATIDCEQISELMDNAPIIISQGKMFDVQDSYLDSPCDLPINKQVASAILKALPQTEGNLLVFLPGAGNIERIYADLIKKIPNNIILAKLYGALSPIEQDRALRPSHDQRKIVLSTSIAETSLTLDNIKVVIDSGLTRIPCFDPNSGMTGLQTVKISKASADQRRGRAGRTSTGNCFRLWTRNEQQYLADFMKAEINNVDLATLALELFSWGVTQPNQLKWLDCPPAGPYAQAQNLLLQLAAIDQNNAITQHGRQIAKLGLHPRLAHMIIKADQFGFGKLACDIAGILHEKDFVSQRASFFDRDLRSRLDILKHSSKYRNSRDTDYNTLERIKKSSKIWQRLLHNKNSDYDLDMTGIILALAYPDRIAKKRAKSQQSFLLSNGQGVSFFENNPLTQHDYLAIGQLDNNRNINLAAPIEATQLLKYFKDEIKEVVINDWSSETQQVESKIQTTLFKLVLKEKKGVLENSLQTQQQLLKGLRELGLSVLPWTKDALKLQARIIFAREHCATELPDFTEQNLLETLEDWLAPYLNDIFSIKKLQSINLYEIIRSSLNWQQIKMLDQELPTHFVVPSGSKIPIDYEPQKIPSLSVRIQELFGLLESPRIAKGKVALQIKLLSPARRPVQITQDLASFWRSGYFEVKKELKGRYPKHEWPEEPLKAQATKYAKRRKRK